MNIKIITRQISHRPVYIALIEANNKVYTETALTIKELLTNIIKLNL